jgi:enamine deaminase RidA (YjgF/YER057c/UK114 family)
VEAVSHEKRIPNCGTVDRVADVEKRLTELGIELLGPLPAGGLYTSVVINGNVAYTSGIVAVEGPPLHVAHAGCVGDDIDIDVGKLGARGALLSTLGTLRGALGSLDRIERFLKMTGFVRAIPGFQKMPAVMDGASELLRDIFGVDLVPARTAIGVSALPGGASVEIDSIVLLAS